MPDNFQIMYSLNPGIWHHYTQSVPIRNGPIRHTSEIFGFLKKRLNSEILKVKKRFGYPPVQIPDIRMRNEGLCTKSIRAI